jgi:hypothetical protein
MRCKTFNYKQENYGRKITAVTGYIDHIGRYKSWLVFFTGLIYVMPELGRACDFSRGGYLAPCGKFVSAVTKVVILPWLPSDLAKNLRSSSCSTLYINCAKGVGSQTRNLESQNGQRGSKNVREKQKNTGMYYRVGLLNLTGFISFERLYEERELIISLWRD